MNSSMDSSLTMTDRLLMEPTFDLEDEEEGEGGGVVQEVEGRQDGAVEGVEVAREEQSVGEVEEGVEVDMEEEDLEQSLQVKAAAPICLSWPLANPGPWLAITPL